MTSSLTTLVGGVGNFVFTGYTLRDSWKQRKKLKGSVEQTNEQMDRLEPEMRREIGPPAEKRVERAQARARGAVANIAADVCNAGSAIVNIVTSSLQIAGNTSSVLGGLQKVGTKFGYATAGVADVYNGCIQSSACVKAVKNWRLATDSQSAKIYGWHAINQGVHMLATWGRAAASFVSVPGLTVSLGVGTVPPAIICAVGTGVVICVSDYICKRKMQAAKEQNPANPHAIQTAMEVRPSQSKIDVEELVESKQKHTPVFSSPSREVLLDLESPIENSQSHIDVENMFPLPGAVEPESP